MPDLSSATVAFTDALAILDTRERRLHQPPLRHQDLSWQQLAGEVHARLTFALDGDGPPDPDTLARAGAWLIVLFEAAVEAAVVRVESGDDEEPEVLAA